MERLDGFVIGEAEGVELAGGDAGPVLAGDGHRPTGLLAFVLGDGAALALGPRRG